nr:MAG: hypothetical protein H1BulkLitter45328_000002 [Mitovirus sp.]
MVVTNPKGLDDASSGYVVSRLTVNSVTPNSETGTQSWITLGKFRKLKPFPSQRAYTTTSEQSEGCNTVLKELGGCDGKRVTKVIRGPERSLLLPWATVEVNHLGFIACLRPCAPLGVHRKPKDSTREGY